MDAIDRRAFMKAAAVGGIAFSICGAQGPLTEARAQGAPLRSAAWPNRRLLDLLKIEHPIVQAPMGGHVGPAMPVAVSGAGGLGSFPCALLTPAQVRDEVAHLGYVQGQCPKCGKPGMFTVYQAKRKNIRSQRRRRKSGWVAGPALAGTITPRCTATTGSGKTLPSSAPRSSCTR